MIRQHRASVPLRIGSYLGPVLFIFYLLEV